MTQCLPNKNDFGFQVWPLKQRSRLKYLISGYMTCPQKKYRLGTCLPWFANNKGVDQPARPRSLISAFVIRLLKSIISKLATNEIAIFLKASVAEETGLYQDLSETHRHVLSRRGPAYSQRSRSNMLIICLTVRNANSSFIFDGGTVRVFIFITLIA